MKDPTGHDVSFDSYFDPDRRENQSVDDDYSFVGPAQNMDEVEEIIGHMTQSEKDYLEQFFDFGEE